MIKTLDFSVAALGAVLTFSLAAQTTPGSDSNVGPAASTSTTNAAQSRSVIRGKEFEKLDKNQDGMVSKEEAKADKDWTKLFTEIDADGDGMIVTSELLVLENRAKASDSTHTLPPGEKSDLGTPDK